MYRLLFWGALALSIIGLDQVTKLYIQNHMIYGESWPVISGLFSITYTQNTGAAFGMGADAHVWLRRIFFLLLPVVACGWLSVLVYRTKRHLLALSYVLILAGAIGNLIDRFYLGFVVDFLDFYWGPHHFWTFNVADASISIAAVLLVLDALLEYRRQKKYEQNLHKNRR